MTADQALDQVLKSLRVAKDLIGEQSRGTLGQIITDEYERGISAACVLHRLATPSLSCDCDRLAPNGNPIDDYPRQQA